MAIEIKCECGSQFRAANRNRGKIAKCNQCGRELLIEGTQVAEYDVFVSYSEKDKATADVVVAAVEAAGLRCWVAPRDILPGFDWGACIIEAISNSRTMVLVFSGHANDSRQVFREVERAISKGVTVIPLRIDEAPLSQNLEYFISTSHWLDAFAGPLEQHLDRLLRTLAAIMAQDDVLSVSVTQTNSTAAPVPSPASPEPSVENAPVTQTLTPSATIHVPIVAQAPIVQAGNTEEVVANPVVLVDCEPFTGTFKSDQLTVAFKGDARGMMTGMITMADKEFPASGAVQSGRLTGSFEAEGAKFDFTAAVDGKTMTLETGGARHILQRPLNPLDPSDVPAPVNPLAAVMKADASA